MSVPTKTKSWILAKKPSGPVKADGSDGTFKLEERDIPELKNGEVLVKTIVLSNDPAQRAWIAKGVDPKRLYTAPVEEGDVMRASAVGEVIESKDDKFTKGKLVQGVIGWTQYKVLPGSQLNPIQDAAGLNPSHFLGAFGLTGLTAWYGLVEVISAKAGESIVVSGASGATGSMVIQIAKHIVGCKSVIGLAGNDEKCRWVESLGADKCINYKHSDWKDQLSSATPDFVEMYFDNVGGEQLDFMLTRLKTHGRVAACGAIAGYETPAKGLQNHFEIISQRLQIKGFIVTDFIKAGGAAPTVKKLVEAAKEGKIKVDNKSETVVETKFEDIPKTWVKLFEEGGKQGKLITKLV